MKMYFIRQEIRHEITSKPVEKNIDVNSNLAKDKVEFNMTIKKPRLEPRKISSTGYFELKFSSIRLFEE